MTKRKRKPKKESPMATNPMRAIPGSLVIDLPGGRIAEISERDSDETAQGQTVTRTRVADTLRRMEMAKTINADQKRAGDEFRIDFQTAHLHGIRPRQMERIDMVWKSGEVLSRVEQCKRRIFRDIEALGGIGGWPASALWHIVGEEWPIQRWCNEMSLHRHKSLNPMLAAGILSAALVIVARTRKII
jgi:hypothetical protein